MGTSARFNFPEGLALSGTTLYVADRRNHRIRAINLASPDKTVSTIASTKDPGHEDGAGSGADRIAQFDNPSGLALSGNTLYVADVNNHRIRAINLASANKTVSTIAGTKDPGHEDGAGSGADRIAQFDNPSGLALSGNTLYVADVNNHRIRAINLASANKTVSTIAGTKDPGHVNGAGRTAQFDNPSGLALSGNTLYVADSNNNRIRAIDLADPNKTVRTIAGDGKKGRKNGIGTAAQFSYPNGIAVRGSTLYVTSGAQIRKLEYR